MLLEWSPILKAKFDTYTPVTTPTTTDVGKCLRATATYTDAVGLTVDMPPEAVSANPVVVDLENRAPVFKAGGQDTGIVITSDTRSIEENSPDSEARPAEDKRRRRLPVTATDPNGGPDSEAEGILTYTLGGSDERSFEIDPVSGQITAKEGTELDYEGKKVYRVTVTATDPSQATTTIALTINVTDQNEPPDIAGDEEIVKDFRENSTSTVHAFRATDPERRPVYWSLSPLGGGWHR